MRLLVTGGTGRLGQPVVEELCKDHELKVFVRHDAPVPANVKLVRGDCTNLGQVYSAMAGMDAVVHMAAIPNPLKDTPEVVFGQNTLGDFNITEAAADLGLKKLVYSGSASALGFSFRTRDFLPEYLPIDEEHPLRPQDAYGLSKWVGERILEAATRRTGLTTISLRVPTVLRRELDGEAIPRVMAAGRTIGIGAYVDARDAAQAIRLALENEQLTGHEVFWITADDALSAVPLCELFPRFLPGSEKVSAELTGTKTSITSAKAKSVLGYRPRYSWRDIVKTEGETAST